MELGSALYVYVRKMNNGACDNPAFTGLELVCMRLTLDPKLISYLRASTCRSDDGERADHRCSSLLH